MESLLGKRIKGVEKKYTWRGDNVEKITLRFDDGTFLSIVANTERGCMNCDEDGSLSDYLSFTDGKK